MKIKRIYACWIYVSDLQRSQEFYRNIGFDIKVVDGDWIEFALGETSFAILKRPESKGVKQGLCLRWRISNLPEMN